jgi:LPS export ABC transporter permease LptG
VRILTRYFLASYLFLFLAILVSSLVAISVVEMMINFDEILAHQKGPAGIASLLFLRVPTHYLRDLVPVVSFIAIFFCLGLPARAHEVTAIKSGGISPRRAFIPLLVAAGVLSGITLLIDESVVLHASRQWNRENNPANEISFRQGSFWYQRGNTIYNVKDVDRDSGILHDVSVFELSPQGRLLRSIRASRVEVQSDHRWNFLDAVERTFDPSQPGDPPNTSNLGEWHRDLGAEKDLAMLEASTQTLSLLNLRDYIALQSREGRESTRYRALYHARLASPLTVLLFALLAVPLGLSIEHSRSIASAALFGIAILAIFYSARTTGDMFASAGFEPAVMSPWLILTVFGGYGSWQLLRIPH